jgi:predicted phosphoribosyltransferase
LKIKSRESAGNILAGLLRDRLKNEARSDIMIVGLPRGGFIVAEIIAKKLSCILYMILVKRLRAPFNEEIAIGAVTNDGTTYLNKSITEEFKISEDYINNEISHQLEEIKLQADMYFDGKSLSYENNNDVTGKTIIIVDDGTATGSTIMATIKCLRNNHYPKRIIVAIPVSPRSTVNLLRSEGIEHVEVIISPADNNFRSIEQFYHNFDQVSHSQILDIIHASKNE